MGGAGRPHDANGGTYAGARRVIDDLMRAAMVAARPICLDSAVLIAVIVTEEPTRSLLRPVLRHPEIPVVVSAVTLAEVVARPAGDGDVARVEAIRRALHTQPRLTIADLDEDHAIEAAFVRGQSGLKLPEAAVVATARLADAIGLIGNDRQWRNKPLGVPYHHMDDILALP